MSNAKDTLTLTKNVRVIELTLPASVFPSICLVVIPYLGCNTVGVLAVVCTSLFTMGPHYSGLRVNIIDMSSNFSATLMAFSNGFGSLSGIISPYMVGRQTPNHTFKEWYFMMWCIFGVASITNIAYVIWATADRRVWDMVPSDRELYFARKTKFDQDHKARKKAIKQEKKAKAEIQQAKKENPNDAGTSN